MVNTGKMSSLNYTCNYDTVVAVVVVVQFATHYVQCLPVFQDCPYVLAYQLHLHLLSLLEFPAHSNKRNSKRVSQTVGVIMAWSHR